MPPDVLKRSALPIGVPESWGFARIGRSPDVISNSPEGQRPSAHQTAEPKPLFSITFVLVFRRIHARYPPVGLWRDRNNRADSFLQDV